MTRTTMTTAPRTSASDMATASASAHRSVPPVARRDPGDRHLDRASTPPVSQAQRQPWLLWAQVPFGTERRRRGSCGAIRRPR
jgi:hypothetical protein